MPHLLARLRALRPGKSWVALGTALAIGLLAALAARSYLAGRVAELEAKARGQSVALVVAKSDLAKGARLTPDTVAVRNVPVEFSHSSADPPEQFARIEGQALAVPVKSGEMILWSLVEGKKAPTFSARVEAGRRAITVPVDDINSMSGLLEPGDLIDLMLTLEQKGRKVTVPFIQALHVMATGQRSVDDPRSGERRTYSTVTLDASVREAENIILARDAGRITALLRNPQDKSDPQGRALDLATLLGSTASVAGYAQEVPVLYGGRAGKLPQDGLTLNRHVQPTADIAVPPAAIAGPLPLSRGPLPAVPGASAGP